MEELLTDLIQRYPHQADEIMDHYILFRQAREAREARLAQVEEEPPEPISELQRIADDSQNVHTGPVNKQTDTNLNLLLNTPIPIGQNTIAEITEAIMHKRKPFKYIADLEVWYGVSIREPDDYLFKRTLDGLWARIKASPHKKELIKRLQEECREMFHKCSQGHISRLCNVMVGFDDDMKPIVSQGELIQDKMSLISSKDISLEEKVMEALHFFREIGLPHDEQIPWIDAL